MKKIYQNKKSNFHVFKIRREMLDIIHKTKKGIK
jgi:hypothetical protein